MASFEDAKQALKAGIPVVIRRRGGDPLVPVAGWADKPALNVNYAAAPSARSHETGILTRYEVNELLSLGAKMEPDP